MKNKVLFLIKGLLSGALSSSILCGVAMEIDSLITHGESAHQIWPDWLVGVVYGLIVGFTVSIIIATIMLFTKKLNLLRLTILAACLSLLILILFFVIMIII